jgi:membrane protein DedA with SNARE-associated domain
MSGFYAKIRHQTPILDGEFNGDNKSMNLGQILDAIKIWAEAIISSMGYPGLTLVMFLENVFPPIPSEIVLPLAGSLTLTGRFSILGVVLWGMVGSLAGALFFYALGKLLGESRVRWLIDKTGKYLAISNDDFDRSLTWFDRYGDWVIFFGRMVPIVRSLISIPAGLASMNMVKFVFYTILGTSCWNFILSFAGRLLGASWPVVADWIGVYQNVVLVLTVLAVAAFLVFRFSRKKQPAKLAE